MADEEIDYEQQRLNNIARNRELLLSLGLEDLRLPDAAPKASKSKSKSKSKPKPKAKPKPPPRTAKRKASSDGDGEDADEDMTAVDGDGSSSGTTPPSRAPKRPKLGDADDAENGGGGVRRSSRNVRRVSYARDGAIAAIRSPSPDTASEDDFEESDDDDDDEEEDEEEELDEDGEPVKKIKKTRKGGVSHGGKKAHRMRQGRADHTKMRNVAKMGSRKHDPKQHGAIPGVEIGTWFETRAQCSQAAIHAPWVAGIHGNEDGAFSIALSGGYADDVDIGDAFTYTGAGGRDLKGTKDQPKNLRTAPQSKDQSFDNPLNATLKASAETKNPVRVIRGYKLPSPYAPESGYRYDGLYTVEKAWMDMGVEGFMVCKYALKRMPGQPPLVARIDDGDADGDGDGDDASAPSEAGSSP